MFTLGYTARKIFIFTYVVKDTFLSNTPFEFCGGLSSFLRYEILKSWKHFVTHIIKVALKRDQTLSETFYFC